MVCTDGDQDEESKAPRGEEGNQNEKDQACFFTIIDTPFGEAMKWNKTFWFVTYKCYLLVFYTKVNNLRHNIAT